MLFEELPEEVECALITSDINRRYFTGMKSSAGVVVAFRNKAYLIIDFRYIEKARNTVKNAEVIEQKKLYQQISQLLKEHSVSSLAIEAQTMTVSTLNSIRNHFKDVEINDREGFCFRKVNSDFTE